MNYKKIDSTHIWKKQHLGRFLFGIAGYSIMLPVTIFLGKNMAVSLPIQIIFAMLPVIPFLLAMSAYIANIRTMDKMWKKVQIDALIMTAMITIAFSFSLGMLQVMNIVGLFSILYLFPFMMFIWGGCFAYLVIKGKLA